MKYKNKYNIRKKKEIYQAELKLNQMVSDDELMRNK